MGKQEFRSPDSFFRSLFEHSSEATVVLDAEGNVAVMNRAARTLRGVDVEGLFAPGSAELASLLPHAAEGGVVEVRATRDDGGLRRLELGVRREGEYRVVVVRDVTARVELEDEVQNLRRIESFGYLMASVAHDFSNLLTVISCSTDALESAARAKETTQSEQVMALASEIHIASERASTMIRQLLTRARRRASRPEPVQVGEVVVELRPLLERLVGGNVELALALDPELKVTVLDRSLLEHALLNMAVNARAAMPNGGTFTVATRNVTLGDDVVCGDNAPGGHYVALSVTDTGVGMSREVRERMFERFFTTKGPAQGTGLGLAMVRRFAKQSGGCVAARSEPGQGTTIALYLPTAPRANEHSEVRPCCHS